MPTLSTLEPPAMTFDASFDQLLERVALCQVLGAGFSRSHQRRGSRQESAWRWSVPPLLATACTLPSSPTSQLGDVSYAPLLIAIEHEKFDGWASRYDSKDRRGEMEKLFRIRCRLKVLIVNAWARPDGPEPNQPGVLRWNRARLESKLRIMWSQASAQAPFFRVVHAAPPLSDGPGPLPGLVPALSPSR